MHLLIILVYFLAAQAYSIDESQTVVECNHTPDKFTRGIGQLGFLKLDKTFSYDVIDLIYPLDIGECRNAVSPNCFQCEDTPSLFCNITTSEDIKYLKSVQPIKSLYLNLKNIKEMSSEFSNALEVTMLELEEGDVTSSDVRLLKSFKNLSTLIMRGKLQMFHNLTDNFSNLENLTTLFVDLSSDPKPGVDQDSTKPQQPGGSEGMGVEELPRKLHRGDQENGGFPPKPGKPFSDYGVAESGITSILPKLRAYGLQSGQPTLQDNTWIINSPIEYFFFRNCKIQVEDLKELLTEFKNSLKYLDLHDSVLSEDRGGIIEGFIPSSLEEIVVSIKDFSNQTILEGFAAVDMGLRSIPYGALEAINNSLQYLSLSKNDFSRLRDKESNASSRDYHPDDASLLTFPPMLKLLELDLSDCLIQSLVSDVFADLPNLRVILLSRNHLASFNADSFRNLNGLKFLDLSRNDNNGIKSYIEKINFTNVPHLEILDISQTPLFKSFKFSGELRNLKRLAMCHSFETLNEIDPRIYETMESLESLNLSGNLALNGTIENDIFAGLKNLKELYLAKCSLVSLGVHNTNSFFNLQSLKLLDVSGNTISFLNDSLFLLLQKLEVILMSSNKIVNWATPVFSNLTYLKELNLKDNYLTSISDAMHQDFRKLHKLSIIGNQFKCGCDTIDFVEMVNTKEGNQSIHLEGWLDNKNICTDEKHSTNIPFQKYSTSECIKNKTQVNPDDTSNSRNFVILFIIAVVVATLTLVTVIAYYKWRDIKFFAILIKNATILSFSNDEPDMEKKWKLYNYDVFISYSDPNRKWVLDELLPNLEIRGNVKVCLHERDFQVGLSILENIISCMDQSKCIMLIISLSFVKSNWCQFELHLAQHRLLETKRENLILVLLEDIPRSKRSKMLNYLMKTKTYIVWPPSAEDQEARKLFWKKIYQAVVLQQSKNGKNISFA